MGFLNHEVVYTGNSLESAQATAKINSWIEANGHIELINISGEFKEGDIVYGYDSGFSTRLSSFTLIDLPIEEPWDTTNMIQSDSGLIAIDAHFTHKDSQDYQQDNIIRQND